MNKQCSICHRFIYDNIKRATLLYVFIFIVLLPDCVQKHATQSKSDFGLTSWDTVSSAFYQKDSIHHGEATFYGIAGEGGNCMLPSLTPWDTLAGAMNHTDYRNSEICGACVKVIGPHDSVVIRINDQCPECKVGDIDLTPNAFARIGPKELGRMPISWHFVPCPVTGNVFLYFNPSSSAWWIGLQVRNHRNPIKSMEVLLDTIGWISITRKPYNRFESSTMPNTPWKLRITDVFGSTIMHTAESVSPGQELEILGQFPESGSIIK